MRVTTCSPRARVRVRSVLWALAALEQKESPLLNGLIKRLVLLAQGGRVNAPQLLLMAQSLAKLGLLGGPIGQALANLTSARLADLHAAQLGTLARCLTEALGGPAAEPLLRQMLASRLAEFTPEQARARMRQSVLETAQLRQEKASSTDLADAELYGHYGTAREIEAGLDDMDVDWPQCESGRAGGAAWSASAGVFRGEATH